VVEKENVKRKLVGEMADNLSKQKRKPIVEETSQKRVKTKPTATLTSVQTRKRTIDETINASEKEKFAKALSLLPLNSRQRNSRSVRVIETRSSANSVPVLHPRTDSNKFCYEESSTESSSRSESLSSTDERKNVEIEAPVDKKAEREEEKTIEIVQPVKKRRGRPKKIEQQIKTAKVDVELKQTLCYPTRRLIVNLEKPQSSEEFHAEEDEKVDELSVNSTARLDAVSIDEPVAAQEEPAIQVDFEDYIEAFVVNMQEPTPIHHYRTRRTTNSLPQRRREVEEVEREQIEGEEEETEQSLESIEDFVKMFFKD
jgi:hypothetical protein